MLNFWKEIKKPVFALAPMEDVTDTAFRELILKISDVDKLHLIFTEFTSVDGMHHPVGRERVSERLVVTESEREKLHSRGVKLIVQIWGNNPELFYKIAKHITLNYDFDGLDVNMGCPARNVVKKGTCSALIDQPELAADIIAATKEGTHLPVSVKTRTGVRKHETVRWMTQLSNTRPAAITLHGRTQKMMSEKPADWKEIALAASVVRSLSPETIFMGNGDIWSYNQGLEFAEKYGTDGIMVGRGIFKNPWFFSPDKVTIKKEEKIEVLLEHLLLYEKAWKGNKNFNILKRFFKIYIHDFEEASKLRGELMKANCPDDIRRILKK